MHASVISNKTVLKTDEKNPNLSSLSHLFLLCSPMELSDRDVIRFNAEQCAKLAFPIGCPVWYNFSGHEGTTLKRGIVKSAALRSSQLVYEITYSDDSEHIITEVVEDKQLGFGATCPVTISSAHNDDSNASEGEIVMCAQSLSSSNSSKFMYSAMIFLEGSRVRYESGIDGERVKYRALDSAVNLADNNNDQPCQEEPTVVSASAKKQSGPIIATTPPSMAENQCVVPTSIRVGHEVDNSVDSSSRKRPRNEEESKVKVESTPRKKDKYPESQPDLEIKVPLWLQKDRETQRKLFHHLLGRSSSGRLGHNMKRINDESQCKIAVVWDEKPMIIKVFAKNKNNVASRSKLFPELKRARQMIQDLFSGFVGNDGSRGRLVYEISRCCAGSHRPNANKSTSNAVRDINPFHTDRSESYISVVDIPNEFVREGKHHQLHMTLVGSIRDIGCKMNIVADGFTHTTKLCAPYVLVYGVRLQDVDQAVKIVEDKIRQT